jgi:hypothetical protein
MGAYQNANSITIHYVYNFIPEFTMLTTPSKLDNLRRPFRHKLYPAPIRSIVCCVCLQLHLCCLRRFFNALLRKNCVLIFCKRVYRNAYTILWIASRVSWVTFNRLDRFSFLCFPIGASAPQASLEMLSFVG